MAFTEFYLQSTGSNLNAGSTNANAAALTYASGNSDGTSLFTVASGNPSTDGVIVGDWVSVYLNAASATAFVGQVTAVSSTTITVSTTAKLGTFPVTGTGTVTCKVRGAWADLGIVTSLFAAGTVPSSWRVNIKAGTFANTTTTRSFLAAGTATAPIWWRGYKVTPGDQDNNNAAVAGTDIPSFTFTTGQFNISAVHQIFSKIDINSAATAAGGAVQVTSGATSCILCGVRITNTAANSASRALTLTGNAAVIGCYFKATTTAAVAVVGNGLGHFLGCVITGGIVGATSAATGTIYAFCVFDSQAGDALQVTASTMGQILNCSFYNPVGHGINFTGIYASGNIVANCYFENVNQAGKAAIANTSGTNTDLIACVGNTYYNCTANLSGITESFTISDGGTLASAGFVAPGSQNFGLNAVAKALGYPGAFENVTAYQGYLDPGAVQRQEPVGGGMVVGRTWLGGYHG